MSLRKRLHGGDVLVGPFCAITFPMVIEMLAGTDFDFLLIDAEHGLVARHELENLVRAGDLSKMPVMFRVPCTEGDWINSALDAGAAGLVVPRIDTAEQARAAVAAMRYPPLGKRGVGPGRATGYGVRLPAYVGSANEDLLLVIQVETAEGLANIDEIAAVEGVDAIYIGPGDLSVSIGAIGPENRDKLDAAITTIIEACDKRGRIAGIFHFTADTLGDALARGLRFHTVGSDGQFLLGGAAATTKAVAEVKAGRTA